MCAWPLVVGLYGCSLWCIYIIYINLVSMGPLPMSCTHMCRYCRICEEELDSLMTADNDDGADQALADAEAGLPAPANPFHGDDFPIDAAPIDDLVHAPGDSQVVPNDMNHLSDPSTFDTVPFDFHEAGLPVGSIPGWSEGGMGRDVSPGPVFGPPTAQEFLDERIRLLEQLHCIQDHPLIYLSFL